MDCAREAVRNIGGTAAGFEMRGYFYDAKKYPFIGGEIF